MTQKRTRNFGEVKRKIFDTELPLKKKSSRMLFLTLIFPRSEIKYLIFGKIVSNPYIHKEGPEKVTIG